MKKKLVVLLLVFVMVFSFAACSGGSSSKDPIVGTWTPSKVMLYGDTYTEKDLKSLMGDYAEQMFDMELKFTEDGKAVGNMYGQTSEGTWENKGDGKYDVTFSYTETLTLDGSELIMGDENEGFIFSK